MNILLFAFFSVASAVSNNLLEAVASVNSSTEAYTLPEHVYDAYRLPNHAMWKRWSHFLPRKHELPGGSENSRYLRDLGLPQNTTFQQTDALMWSYLSRYDPDHNTLSEKDTSMMMRVVGCPNMNFNDNLWHYWGIYRADKHIVPQYKKTISFDESGMILWKVFNETRPDNNTMSPENRVRFDIAWCKHANNYVVLMHKNCHRPGCAGVRPARYTNATGARFINIWAAYAALGLRSDASAANVKYHFEFWYHGYKEKLWDVVDLHEFTYLLWGHECISSNHTAALARVNYAVEFKARRLTAQQSILAKIYKEIATATVGHEDVQNQNVVATYDDIVDYIRDIVSTHKAFLNENNVFKATSAAASSPPNNMCSCNCSLLY